MASYLITGSSRGIGLSLTKQLAARPASEVGTIFAASRSDNSLELKKLIDSSNGRIVWVQIDVNSEESIKNAAKAVEAKLGGKGLDVLINNAGVMLLALEGIHTMNHLDEVLHTNVTGVHMMTSAFLPLLRNGTKKQVINISTTVGSFAYKHKYTDLPVPAYKISKAALNMLTVQYADAFAEEGFTFVAISPGWLQTELGGGEMADLPVDTGIEAVLKVMDKLDKSSNGKFLDIHVAGWENAPGRNQYPGGEIPW